MELHACVLCVTHRNFHPMIKYKIYCDCLTRFISGLPEASTSRGGWPGMSVFPVLTKSEMHSCKFNFHPQSAESQFWYYKLIYHSFFRHPSWKLVFTLSSMNWGIPTPDFQMVAHFLHSLISNLKVIWTNASQMFDLY